MSIEIICEDAFDDCAKRRASMSRRISDGPNRNMRYNNIYTI